MRRLGLIPAGSEVVTVWHRRLEYAYPTPFLGRNELLGRALGGLKEAGIYSRGRFGAWKYEVGNMDHSVMQGVEAVDSILLGESETTVERPDVVNAARYRGQRPVRPAGEWGPS